MLVDINLLPKKEHKASSSFSIALIFLFLLALVFIGVFVQVRVNETSLNKVNQQIQSVQQLNAAIQTKITDQASSDSPKGLQEAVTWAETSTPDTVRLLRSLIALLPEQGFIQSLNYNGEGIVGVKVEFESAREAAYFLSSLQHSKWVDTASILTVEAVREASNSNEIMPTYYSEFEIHFKREYFTEASQKVGGNES
ncbi:MULTISPECIES: hypothetical protein [Mesobacillus]|uniref:Fimbrial protein n=2 Tax=Mesobacillus TaxID=2675231 RepID=A0A0D6ZA46_9BACI|nr:MULTISPECIES: hypothetical protein [Mesobacillus]KIY22377.1 hypothetical protein UB32_08775 [Mesobacillus subterraneus]MDQ0414180.1 type IV pilus assembly protein PilN [Mesobacillus stamsii]